MIEVKSLNPTRPYYMKRILVLCTGNSARSQMAQGYLQYFAGEHAEVLSAGVDPKGVNPSAFRLWPKLILTSRTIH